VVAERSAQMRFSAYKIWFARMAPLIKSQPDIDAKLHASPATGTQSSALVVST
jgi:hypothetical protein